MIERHDTVMIGGGQAGLAMSCFLREQGREHVILERRRLGERWRSERWDSLYFQFPNWSFQLPGHPYAGDAPDAFAHYSEVVRYLEGYGDAIEVPLRCGVGVSSLVQDPATGRFLIGTPECMLEASRVVIATGNVHGVAPGLGTTAARSRPSRALSKLTVHGAVGADERRAIEQSRSFRQS